MKLTEFICVHCGRSLPRNRRLGEGRQVYCGRKECQRARRAAWKRRKIAEDPDYRRNHNDGNRSWRVAHPDYWRTYRSSHPDAVQRNRDLQRVRRSRSTDGGPPVWVDAGGGVAKVDASTIQQPFNNTEIHGHLRGDFWLIPRVAKVNALLVRIVVISSDYVRCKEPLDGGPCVPSLSSAAMPGELFERGEP
jgi:hypothetical protein